MIDTMQEELERKHEIGCNDAAMWKVEATNWREKHEAMQRKHDSLRERYMMVTEERAEWHETRANLRDELNVAHKRIDQLLAERGESVSQEVDHLAVAKEWAGQTDDDGNVSVHHSLISIATSLATLAGCVSDMDASYKYLRTQPGR